MQFTSAARDLLCRLEGCRLTAYRDSAGIWTIGYGHTGREVVQGLVWTQPQAEAALDADLARFTEGVRKLVGLAALSDNQYSALVIFAFNVGLVAFAGSTALRDIHGGWLQLVPQHLALWNKIHDASGVPVVSLGLVARREAEAALWRTQG